MDPVSKSKATVSGTKTTQNATECFQACVENHLSSNCLTWTFDNATKICYLYDAPQLNLNTFNTTAQSGYAGTWYKTQDRKCANYRVSSDSVGPSGDIATCALNDDVINYDVTFTTGNATSDILEAFAAHGVLDNNAHTKGLNGASAMRFTLRPGESKTATFLLAWHFPNRDFMGKTMGNRYAGFYPSLEHVVTHVAGRLPVIAQDIAMLHAAFTNSSLDPFLQDILINSLSHIRSAMWFGDSR